MNLLCFLPMSGGVQPLMLAMAEHFSFVGIVNAYLPEMHLPFEKSQELLEANAHPSCTDFLCKITHETKKPVFWIGSEKKPASTHAGLAGKPAIKNMQNY